MYTCILNYVYMQDYYVYMQDNYVYMQDIYVYLTREICIHVYLIMYTCKIIMYT